MEHIENAREGTYYLFITYIYIFEKLENINYNILVSIIVLPLMEKERHTSIKDEEDRIR